MEAIDKKSMLFNRSFYELFVLLMLFQVFVNQAYLEGASALGIALIFDPFNQKTTWNDRPLWQRIWLVFHLILLVVLFVLGINIF